MRKSGILAVLLALAMPFAACSKINQEQNPYKLYKFPLKHSFIALSPLPGRVNLEEDLQTISASGITHVLTLISDEELTHYKVPELKSRLSEKNISVMQSPITDYGLPSNEQMNSLLQWIHKRVKAHDNLLIHCVGGLGRSGTVMAVYAKAHLGKTGQEAIDYVREIRGSGAVETEEQQNFVLNW